jgi:hypothetical protein
MWVRGAAQVHTGSVVTSCDTALHGGGGERRDRSGHACHERVADAASFLPGERYHAAQTVRSPDRRSIPGTGLFRCGRDGRRHLRRFAAPVAK